MILILIHVYSLYGLFIYLYNCGFCNYIVPKSNVTPQQYLYIYIFIYTSGIYRGVYIVREHYSHTKQLCWMHLVVVGWSASKRHYIYISKTLRLWAVRQLLTRWQRGGGIVGHATTRSSVSVWLPWGIQIARDWHSWPVYTTSTLFFLFQYTISFSPFIYLLQCPLMSLTTLRFIAFIFYMCIIVTLKHSHLQYSILFKLFSSIFSIVLFFISLIK